MNKTCLNLCTGLLSLLMVGCSVEKPADASDPKVSAAWIKSTLKQAEKSTNAGLRSQLLISAYEHAEQMEFAPEASAEQLRTVPKQVYALAMKSENLDDFRWALDQGIKIDVQYHELLKFWKLGPEWREFIVADHTTLALPIFMSHTADDYSVQFFDLHIDEFYKTGFKVKSPLEQTEFNIRFGSFIGELIGDAVEEKNRARLEFLIDHTPTLQSVVYIDLKMKNSMRALGDFVFHELKDEELACKLVSLGYELNRIDLSKLDFGNDFKNVLKADSDYAIHALRLSEWHGVLSTNDLDFILTLPVSAMKAIQKNHVDAILERSMEMKDTEATMRLIAMRSERYPPTRSTYTELINWALAYSNLTVFDYVMEQDEEMNIFSIDFGMLARNQELFLKYAPIIMQNVYYTMDTHPRKNGTTIGQIKEVFACANEDAGLYLVYKYNLAKAWVEATSGRTLLMDVCEAGNLKAARFLIEKRGAKIHAQTGYSELQISIFGSTRPTEGKLSPIFFAAKSGNPELIKYLVIKGADVNSRSNFGATPLMHAVSGGHVEAGKILISARANVHAKMDVRVSQSDMRGVGNIEEILTAYRRAKTLGNQEILDLLIKAGAHR